MCVVGGFLFNLLIIRAVLFLFFVDIFITFSRARGAFFVLVCGFFYRRESLCVCAWFVLVAGCVGGAFSSNKACSFVVVFCVCALASQFSGVSGCFFCVYASRLRLGVVIVVVFVFD